MEQVLRELKNYSRWLYLEGKIPGLEDALAEAKELCIESDGRVRLLQWELERLEKPGFFQRLKGGLEEKQEETYREYRIAQAQLQSVQEEVDLRRKELDEARAEYAALSSSWDAYLKEKEQTRVPIEGEGVLLTGICIGLTRDCQSALEQARNWMRQDVLRTGVSSENRKLEFLALAMEKAERIQGILDQLAMEKPPYLRNPESYITGVTMEYKQLDRVNLAIEQVWELRQKLKGI